MMKCTKFLSFFLCLLIKNNFKKIISVSVTVSLLVSFVIGPTAADAMFAVKIPDQSDQLFNTFYLPYSFGQITSAHYGATDRVLINIQDLHSHPQVQKNISNIIELFDKKYGVNKVFLEGAYGSVSTKWIEEKTNKRNKAKILDMMLKTGRLTGAEYYSAKSDKTDIIEGLEKKEPYLDNLKRFGQLLEEQDKVEQILKAISESTKELKDKYYGKRQKKIEQLSQEYKNDEISSKKYYSIISKHINKLGINLNKYENTFAYINLIDIEKDLDYGKITRELQNLVLILKNQLSYAEYKKLLEYTDNFSRTDSLRAYILQLSKIYKLKLKTNFPNIDKYFKYIEISQIINPIEMIAEEDKLRHEINTRFSETKAQREVVFLIDFEKYLRDYITTKITSDDYKYYKENINRYIELYNKYADNRLLSLLDPFLREVDNFYEINSARNIYFTDNLFGPSSSVHPFIHSPSVSDSQSEISKIIENMKDVKTVDIVITGGFHSQTVTDILKDHGVSYIVITPNVTDGVKLAEETYHDIVKEQSKISFQTLASLILSLSRVDQIITLGILGMKDDEIAKYYSPEDMQAAKVEKIKTLPILQNLDGQGIPLAMFLQNDDLGDVKKAALNIIRDTLGKKADPETVDKIRVKQLSKLINDKKSLEKVVNILSEKNPLKQAIMAVVDLIGTPNKYSHETQYRLLHLVASYATRMVEDLFDEEASVSYDLDAIENPYINILIRKNDKIYSLRFNKRDHKIYVKTEEEHYYSKDTSRYKDKESIRKEFGLIITDINGKLTIKSRNKDTRVAIFKQETISALAETLHGKDIDINKDKETLDVLTKELNAETETIFLDKLTDYDKDRITKAATDYKLLVVYPLSKVYDMDDLSTEQKYALYQQFAYAIDLVRAFPVLAGSEEIDGASRAALMEFVKNAIIHGNLADLSKPIYIKYDEDGFTVYNVHHDGETTSKELLSLSAVAGLSGFHIGLEKAQENAAKGLFELTPEKDTIIKMGKTQFYVIGCHTKNISKQETIKTEVSVDYNANIDRNINILVKRNDEIYFAVYNTISDTVIERSNKQDHYGNINIDKEIIEDEFGIKIENSATKDKLTVTSSQDNAEIYILKQGDIFKELQQLDTVNINPDDDKKMLDLLKDYLSLKDSDVETISLDDIVAKEIKTKIAIEENKLLVVYPFMRAYDMEGASIQAKYAVYKRFARVFDLMKSIWLPVRENNRADNLEIAALQEFVKNAIIHGNLADLSKPIYIKYNKNGFVVYNVYHDGELTSNELLGISAAAGVIGEHKGLANAEQDAAEGYFSLTPEKDKIIIANDIKFYQAGIVRKNPIWSELRLDDMYEMLDSIRHTEDLTSEQIIENKEIFKQKSDKLFMNYVQTSVKLAKALLEELDNDEFEVLSEELQTNIFYTGIEGLDKKNISYMNQTPKDKDLIDLLEALFSKKGLKVFKESVIGYDQAIDELFDNIKTIFKDFSSGKEEKNRLFKIVRDNLDIFTEEQQKELKEFIDVGNAVGPQQYLQQQQYQPSKPSQSSAFKRGETDVNKILDSIADADKLHVLSLADRDLVIANIIDFIHSDKSKKEDVVKVLKKLAEIFTAGASNFFSGDMKKTVYRNIMGVIKKYNYLSEGEKLSLLAMLSRNISFFVVNREEPKTQRKDADMFFDECYELLKNNKGTYIEFRKNIASNIYKSSHLYSMDKLNKLAEFLLKQDRSILSREQNNDLNTENLIYVMTNVAYLLNSEYYKKIYALAINYLKSENKNNEQQDFDEMLIMNKMLESLVMNFSLLYKSQRSDVVSLVMHRSKFWQEIDFDIVNILIQLLTRSKYLTPGQKMDISNRLEDILSNSSVPSVFLENLLEYLSYDEFECLGEQTKSKVINHGINLLIRANFNKKAHDSFPVNENALKWVAKLFLKRDFFSYEQISKLFNNVSMMPNTFHFNDEENFRLYEMIYANIDLFDIYARKIEDVVESFNAAKFVSAKIENVFVSPLVKKIRSVSNRVINRYRFLQFKDLSSDEKQQISKRINFQIYKNLEAVNLKALKLLVNLSSESDLKDVKKAIMEMFVYYKDLAPVSVDKSEIVEMETLINKFFAQENIDINKQRDLHQYNIRDIFRQNLKDVTINDLINVIHQTAISYFKKKMNAGRQEDNPYGDGLQETSVLNFSKDGYISPEIRKLLSKIEPLGFVTISFDENTLVVSIVPTNDHSITIVLNTSNINRGISFSFYDYGAEYRVICLEKMLQKLGFETERNVTFLSAKFDKTNGLTEDSDLIEIFNAVLKIVYLTTNPDEYNYALFGVEDYVEKYMFAEDNNLYEEEFTNLYEIVDKFYKHVREDNVFNTRDRLNDILNGLDLPEIPKKTEYLYEEPKTKIKFLGQAGVDRYFNRVIERAFVEGKFVIDDKGYLVKNDSFDEMKNIKDLLDDIDVERQNDILKQATIIDELNKQNEQILNLQTKAVIGQLEYQEGYLQLTTGEYIFVKGLKNSINGMIRYASAERISQYGTRTASNWESLTDKLIRDGYKIYTQIRAKTEREKETFRKELTNVDKEEIKSISKAGKLLGGKTRTVVGKVVFDAAKADEESILFKEFLSPEDMIGTLQAKGLVLTSGMELSHQGLIVKENGIPASIITGVIFKKDGDKTVAEIKYTEYADNGQEIDGVNVRKVVEKTVTVDEGDDVAIDGDTGRVIFFSKSHKGYKEYKAKEKSDEIAKKKEVEQKQEDEFISVEANPVWNFEDNIKSFGEDFNGNNFGTKSTSLHEMDTMTSDVKRETGIDAQVPYGIMIGVGAFSYILQKKNKRFKDLDRDRRIAIENGYVDAAEDANGEIRKIVESLNKEDLLEIKKIIKEKIKFAIEKGYISKDAKFAVRSAFKGEDGAKFSAAGVGESKVGVEIDEIADALINVVLMSMYSDRSIAYQCANRHVFEPAALVQVAVDSKKSAVMMVRGNRVTISGSLGQGEIVVSGEKAQSKVETELDQNSRIEILDYITERQDYQYVLNGEVEQVSIEDSTREIFTEKEIEDLSRLGFALRDRYGYDSDIEVAIDKIYQPVQIRPITSDIEEVSISSKDKSEVSIYGGKESLVIAANEDEAEKLRNQGANAVYFEQVSSAEMIDGTVIDTDFKGTGKSLRIKIEGNKIKYNVKADVKITTMDLIKALANEISSGRFLTTEKQVAVGIKIKGSVRITRLLSADGEVLAEIKYEKTKIDNSSEGIIDVMDINKGISVWTIRDLLSAA